jgi:hypothetical protein
LRARYIGPEQLARGDLGGAKVLILPSVVALSAADAVAVQKFVANGGRVIADVVPGSFDEHGRRLPRASLADLFESGSGRIVPVGDRAGLAEALSDAGVKPAYPVQAPDNDVTTYVYRLGGRMILALQRDFTDSETSEPASIALPNTILVEDLRSGKSLGRAQRLDLMLDAITPAVLALPGISR